MLLQRHDKDPTLARNGSVKAEERFALYNAVCEVLGFPVTLALADLVAVVSLLGSANEQVGLWGSLGGFPWIQDIEEPRRALLVDSSLGGWQPGRLFVVIDRKDIAGDVKDSW